MDNEEIIEVDYQPVDEPRQPREAQNPEDFMKAFRGLMVTYDNSGNVVVSNKDFDRDYGEYILMLKAAVARLELFAHVSAREKFMREQQAAGRRIIVPGQ